MRDGLLKKRRISVGDGGGGGKRPNVDEQLVQNEAKNDKEEGAHSARLEESAESDSESDISKGESERRPSSTVMGKCNPGGPVDVGHDQAEGPSRLKSYRRQTFQSHLKNFNHSWFKQY